MNLPANNTTATKAGPKTLYTHIIDALHDTNRQPTDDTDGQPVTAQCPTNCGGTFYVKQTSQQTVAMTCTSGCDRERVLGILGVTDTTPQPKHETQHQPDWPTDPTEENRVRLTPASQIEALIAKWLWDGRIALGTLALLAGPPDVGKSTVSYTIAAQITLGTLEGCYYHKPRAVLVDASEDSWAHTIRPRLEAAGANLDRVYRIDAVTPEGRDATIRMPYDIPGIQAAAEEVEAALLIVDPIISRLGKLDTHRDAEVRQGLEPLVAMADRTGMSIIGLIHHKKGTASSPVELVMGSTGFAAVARSVHTVIKDPDDETVRLFGTTKNNLGRGDLPTLAFTIETAHTPARGGHTTTSRLVWGEERDETVSDTIARYIAPEDRTAAEEAADWLTDYLTTQGGGADSGDVKKAAKAVGHSDRTLGRARRKARVTASPVPGAFPRRTTWSLPAPQDSHANSRATHPRTDTGGTTGTTGADLHSHATKNTVVPHNSLPRETGTTVGTTGADPGTTAPPCEACARVHPARCIHHHKARTP